MLPATYIPDDPLGVRHDVLVDAREELKDAKYKLQEMHVYLDVLADDREGIWEEGQYETLRRMQEDISTLIGPVEESLNDVRDELDRVKSEKRE